MRFCGIKFKVKGDVVLVLGRALIGLEMLMPIVRYIVMVCGFEPRLKAISQFVKISNYAS